MTSSAHEDVQMAPVLDPDAVARSIRDTLPPQDDSNIEAGRRVLLEADKLLKAHESFTAETTPVGQHLPADDRTG